MVKILETVYPVLHLNHLKSHLCYYCGDLCYYNNYFKKAVCAVCCAL